MTVYSIAASPIGDLLLTMADGRLTRLLMEPYDVDPAWRRDDEALRPVAEQLAAYFAGDLQDFDVELAPEGTDFQLRVWSALREIPYGETWSYGELATRIGNPNASRAVGLANGRNPISVIVPCHRVIGASGKLVGYGGGLDRKKVLLDLETRTRRGTQQSLV
jgi:methylated-DNA-[protein]-cysteine S-methyltransferase